MRLENWILHKHFILGGKCPARSGRLQRPTAWPAVKVLKDTKMDS